MIKVYIAAHKAFEVPDQSGYLPIQAGKAIASAELDYIGDDTGDNISFKNRSFCELTVLYWIWKNSLADVVGLVHYRRYFFAEFFPRTARSILAKEQIEALLQSFDAILPMKTVMIKYSVKENYRNRHHIEDLEACGQAIRRLHPEYAEAFAQILKSHRYYAFNMFIMRKNLFDEYMVWLFSILDAVEWQIDTSHYDNYNKRVFGFLAERLFNVWIAKKHLRIRELPVYNTEQSLQKQELKAVEDIIKGCFVQ